MLGQQTNVLAKIRQARFFGFSVEVLGDLGGLREPAVTFTIPAAVAAVRTQQWQPQIDQHRTVVARRNISQRQRLRQGIRIRRRVMLPVGEDGRNLQRTQRPDRQPLGVETALPHTPSVGVESRRHLAEATFVICVLTLEVLRPQKQPFAPENFRHPIHITLFKISASPHSRRCARTPPHGTCSLATAHTYQTGRTTADRCGQPRAGSGQRTGVKANGDAVFGRQLAVER